MFPFSSELLIPIVPNGIDRDRRLLVRARMSGRTDMSLVCVRVAVVIKKRSLL